MKIKLAALLGIVILLACGANTDSDPTSSDKPTKPSKTPKNIIFLIGDGMGVTQVTSGMIANGNRLQLERCSHTGLMKTFSGDDLITDSAAGATAFSTGKKTYNGAIGVGMDSLPLPTIVEAAEKKGLATGLVATCSITHATPASYYAHQKSRAMNEAIAADMLKVPLDVVIGGGRKFFNQREDGKDLVKELTNKGYAVFDTMKGIQPQKDKPFVVFTANEHPGSIMQGRPVDYLTQAASLAIQQLSFNDKGFFLVIEGSQIDWGGHENNADYIMKEMVDFDRMVGQVLDFAEKDGNTLVVITADHETGGFAINGGSLKDRSITPAFTTLHHTAAMVPVFAWGPGAEQFSGIMDNTAIFKHFTQFLHLTDVQ